MTDLKFLSNHIIGIFPDDILTGKHREWIFNLRRDELD